MHWQIFKQRSITSSASKLEVLNLTSLVTHCFLFCFLSHASQSLDKIRQGIKQFSGLSLDIGILMINRTHQYRTIKPLLWYSTVEFKWNKSSKMCLENYLFNEPNLPFCFIRVLPPKYKPVHCVKKFQQKKLWKTSIYNFSKGLR